MYAIFSDVCITKYCDVFNVCISMHTFNVCISMHTLKRLFTVFSVMPALEVWNLEEYDSVADL
jgi:hypothetical protein